ncbi:hypothetical protein ACH5RR_037242 [Cinchona calisaya]|uniref:RNase H type-1 domain-containing protein n=1 Tax=Cinchona calisaya TaxID=153742 RepID=A0ABD2Y6V3_9GENT
MINFCMYIFGKMGRIVRGTFVYAKSTIVDTRILWSDLALLAQNVRGPWPIGGDFNVLSSLPEYSSRATQHLRGVNDFTAAMDASCSSACLLGPLPLEVLELNVDSSSLGNPEAARGEGIIRITYGFLVAEFSIAFVFKTNMEAVSLALAFSIRLCLDRGWSNVSIENKLFDPSSNVSREANAVADMISKWQAHLQDYIVFLIWIFPSPFMAMCG